MHKQIFKLTTIKQVLSFVKNWGLLALWVHFFSLTNPTQTLIYTSLMFIQSFAWDYMFSCIQVRYVK